jgi:NADH-quinone oxidoreductase subunit L
MLETIPESAVWAIFALPLASLLVIGVLLPRSMYKYAGHVAALAIGIAFVLSLWALDSSLQEDGARLAFSSQQLLTVGELHVDVALNIDGLTALMLVVVTGVAFMVQIYSLGYMHGDTGYWRYFAYMSLFTASMLGLVLFDSILLIYVFWEMVGLSSYLLIGFWFDRPAAAAAAKKAFLMTRFGDLGFLAAILLIYAHAGTFNIPAIQEAAIAGALGASVLTWFALGVFAGAAGKSAQFPLHTWLPDAMEGPTPVSALVHSATMVAAGVYLVARFFPVFSVSHDAMLVVGAVGGITALSAALLALVMTDIKRVLAYSTISQLGYMMLALGVGGYTVAIFHLFTHAFFKALLFLGSGSVNHATNTFDMRKMGGLRKYMPITTATFLIGTLSLAGFFPLAGFWSKDEILGVAYDERPWLFVVALVTAGLTAFYMFRAIFLTFGGEYRGGEPAVAHGTAHEEHASHDEHAHAPHESPFSMALPLIILAVPAIFAGFANISHDVERLLLGALPADVHPAEPEFHMSMAVAATIVPLFGVVLAWAIYSAKLISSEYLAKNFRPVHRLLENKYYLDVLYERLIVRDAFIGAIGGALETFDRVIVDGAVNGAGQVTRGAASGLRYVQNGQFNVYGTVGFAGLAFAVLLALVLGPL